MGTAEPLSAGQLAIFPNPAQDRITLDLSAFTGTLRLELLDALGRTVQQQVVSAGPCVVNVSACPPGMYLVRIIPYSDQYDGRRLQGRFVKE